MLLCSPFTAPGKYSSVFCPNGFTFPSKACHWNHTGCSQMCLASSPWHGDSEIPHVSEYQYFPPSERTVTFHWMRDHNLCRGRELGCFQFLECSSLHGHTFSDFLGLHLRGKAAGPYGTCTFSFIRNSPHLFTAATAFGLSQTLCTLTST